MIRLHPPALHVNLYNGNHIPDFYVLAGKVVCSWDEQWWDDGVQDRQKLNRELVHEAAEALYDCDFARLAVLTDGDKEELQTRSVDSGRLYQLCEQKRCEEALFVLKSLPIELAIGRIFYDFDPFEGTDPTGDNIFKKTCGHAKQPLRSNYFVT